MVSSTSKIGHISRRRLLSLASAALVLTSQRAMAASKIVPSFARPAVGLLPQPDSKSLSHFGGSPVVPGNFEWPQYKGKPLDFLLQIELGEIGNLNTGLELPSTGRLLFFYDTHDQKWGFDPADRGCSSVIWLDGSGDDKRMLPREGSPLPEVEIAFSAKNTLPDPLSDHVDTLNLTAEQKQLLSSTASENDPPYAQIGGFPALIQNDTMELESEATSAGIHVGDNSAWMRSLDAAAVKQKWQLLLQLPSMEAYGTLWGDNGNLYFWIRRDDLARRDFSKVWLILQCY